jgi:predicted CxxxxCH...CXXCH cytochrome family protein
VNWQATVTCGSCHGVPPATPSHAFLGTNPPTTSCSGCHAGTVNADGTINTTDGKHVNGNPDFGGGGSGCAGCHGYPSGSGAHAVHFGLVGAETGAAYGETDILEDRYPLATPTTAPSSYAFGCGNCHPTDLVKHFSGTVDIDLAPATAPAGSLKSLNAPTASYDRATGTCSGVYCHSSGQTTPTFVTTPAWRAVDPALGCDGCHTNPPRYPSGGAGTATANSHLQLQEDGYEWGHFLGLVGPWHTSQHGGAVAGEDSSPITCQTCHYETTDPSNTGPSRFYYLDTTGEYVIPGSLSTVAFKASITCTTCHNGVGNTARGTGKILPLRHVNGTRNVVFDARLTLDPTITWLPAAPNKPVQAYWMTSADVRNLWPSYVVWSGTTASFSFATSTYNPATKTCSNIACHLSQTNPVWGKPFLFRTGGIAVNCTQCHP